MIRVVVVEDDEDLLEDVLFSLGAEGLRVSGCPDAPALDQLLATEPFDVAVLDIGLPGEDGLAIARRLRRQRPGLAIVMLTARTATRDRIRGMEEGADAYLGKPVDMRELALVIRAVARRMGLAGDAASRGLTLLLSDQVLLLADGRRMELTPGEAAILSRLARATGGQASRRQLVEALGETWLDYDERRLEAMVSRLRRKFAAAGLPADSLRALRGSGYVLQGSIQERQG